MPRKVAPHADRRGGRGHVERERLLDLVLVYATARSAPFRDRSRVALSRLAAAEPLAVSRQILREYIAVMTRQQILGSIVIRCRRGFTLLPRMLLPAVLARLDGSIPARLRLSAVHSRGSPATALRHRDLLARVLEVEAAEQPPHTRACQSRDGSPCDQARCDQARWFGAVQWTSGMIFCGLFSRVWTRSMLIRPLVWRRFPIRRRGAGPSTEYPT